MKIFIFALMLFVSSAVLAEFDHYGKVDALEGNTIIVNDLPYRLTADTRFIAVNGGDLDRALIVPEKIVGQLVGVLHTAVDPENLAYEARVIRLLPKNYRFKGEDFWSQPENPLAR